MRNKISIFFDYITKALFASIIVGVVLVEVGKFLELSNLIDVGNLAKYLMGTLIGLSIARYLKVKNMTLYISPIIGAVSAGSYNDGILSVGDPILAIILSFITIFIINKFEKGKVLDIIVIPIIGLIISSFLSILISPFINLTGFLSSIIEIFMGNYPDLTLILLVIVFSVAITGPFSSVLFAIILNLQGNMAFIAVAVTTAQMISFFIMSIRDNGFKNSLLVLFGSSKIQLKNIILHPSIFIPSLIVSFIAGYMAFLNSNLISVVEAAGMGNLLMIGPLLTIFNNPKEEIYLIIIILYLIPFIVSIILNYIWIKFNLIKKGDLKL